MWPFKKKTEPELSWIDSQVVDLIAFRGVGEKLKYLGIDMIVCNHRNHMGLPRLICDYVDNNGIVRQVQFSHTELQNRMEKERRGNRDEIQD